jgi:pimeloyl-ACP methyl ester carboxylesterase
LLAASFAAPPPGALDISGEEQALVAARSRESLARYGWAPYMHDPKLLGRLHRINVPTLLLRGSGDGITGEDYTRAFGDAIPGARFAAIEAAGHLPHIEQPRRFADTVKGAFPGTGGMEA